MVTAVAMTPYSLPTGGQQAAPWSVPAFVRPLRPDATQAKHQHSVTQHGPRSRPSSYGHAAYLCWRSRQSL